MIESDLKNAWDQLRSKLHPFVARRVEATDVEDVLQEVLVRLHKNQSQLHNQEAFGAWVYRVTNNAITDYQRTSARYRSKTSTTKDQEELENLSSSQQDNHSEVTTDSEAEQLIAQNLVLFVAMLPSPYREAITLVELEGISQTEAAKMLGINLSTMKSRVQRGRERLRQLIQACCEIQLDSRGKVIECHPRNDPQWPKDCCKQPSQLTD